MAEQPIEIQLLQALTRTVNEMRGEINGRLDQIEDRLAHIESDRLAHRQRIQAVEQHAAAFVEQGANINRRMDDVVERIDRLSRAHA